MAQEIARNTITFRDARGHTGKVSFYVAYDRTVANSMTNAHDLVVSIQADLAALSNGAIVGSTGLNGAVFPPNVYGASLVYGTSEDKLRLRMLAADNTIHTLAIPAPVIAAFEADQETALGCAIAALVAALKTAPAASAFPCTRAGSAFAASLGGQLTRKKFQRKLTIYAKSANLDEPEE